MIGRIVELFGDERSALDRFEDVPPYVAPEVTPTDASTLFELDHGVGDAIGQTDTHRHAELRAERKSLGSVQLTPYAA